MGIKKRSENDVVRECLNVLGTFGILAWRANQLPVPGRTFRGRKGVPDICAIANRPGCKGMFLGIECKMPGEAQRPEQLEFERLTKESCGFYFVVTSVDDLLCVLKQLGY